MEQNKIPLPGRKNVAIMPKTQNNNLIPSSKSSSSLQNNDKVLMPNNKVLIPKSNRVLIPSTNKSLIPNTNKSLIPSINRSLLPSSNRALIPNSNRVSIPTSNRVSIPKSPSKTEININNKKMTFNREMIDEDTIIDFAISLDKDNFRELLNFLSDYYYNEESLISDDKFNQLENIYKELYGEYEAEWPKARGETVLLPYHLSSLKKMIEEKDINNWTKNHPGPYLLQDKIDGVTLLLVSEMINNKRKISLFTHGDGVEGTDISHILEFLTLPKIDFDIAIRGEGVYTLEVFDQFKERFRNPRNMITGTLLAKKSFDPEVVKHLSFYSYQIRSETNTPYQ